MAANAESEWVMVFDWPKIPWVSADEIQKIHWWDVGLVIDDFDANRKSVLMYAKTDDGNNVILAEWKTNAKQIRSIWQKARREFKKAKKARG